MSVASPYSSRLARIPVDRGEVELLGSTTRFWTYGPSDAATTVVAIHGFRGDHHGLEPLAAHLPGLRVIVPDLPGFGESAPLTGVRHSVDSYARWLRELCARVAPDGFVLLGHSFGSIIVSAALADREAEPRLRPSAVVLVNPIGAPALEGPRGVMSKLAVGYFRLGAALPERLGFELLGNRVVVRVTSLAMVKTHDRALRAFIHDQHDRYFSAFADRGVVLEAFEASIGDDVSRFAADVAEPTLLIAAERDDITSVDDQRTLVTRFPDARLEVIPDVGHLIHYETPAAAAALVERFLAEVAGGDGA